jgi:hypothetical protein
MNNPPLIRYEGINYTFYRATQKQRQIERSIRRSQRRIMAYDAAGLKQDYTAETIRLKRLRGLYQDFSSQTGLVKQNQRTIAAGWGRNRNQQKG